MLPRLASAQFGLLDDGYTLQTASKIANNNLALNFEHKTGRFRPVYWFFQTIVFLLVEKNPFGYFLINLFLLVATSLLLYYFVQLTGGSFRNSWITSIIFICSGPIIENYYTLSKAEPPQALFILCSLILINIFAAQKNQIQKLIHFLLTSIFIFMAFSTKETTIVLIPISFIWFIIAHFSDQYRAINLSNSYEKFYFLATTIGAGLFFILKRFWGYTSSVDGSYTQYFSINIFVIMSTILRYAQWLLRDFAFVIPIFIYYLLYHRKTNISSKDYTIMYNLVWIVGWLAIYLPWMYTSEYYLLPFTIGLSLFVGTILDQIITDIKQSTPISWVAIIFLCTTLVLFTSTLAINISNAEIQLASDRMNTELVKFIASNIPEDSSIYLNYPENHEYLQEISLHLDELYGRSNIGIATYSNADIITQIGSDQSIYLINNIVGNPIPLSVRLGSYEEETTRRNLAVAELLKKNGELVFYTQEDHRIFYIDFARILCPGVNIPIFCNMGDPLIHYNIFTYGWKIYRLHKD